MNPVDKYVDAKKELFRYFNCRDEYQCRHLPVCKWQIREDSDIFFLSYWYSEKDINKSVVVKKEGRPLVFTTAEHTMIIAIDCIKIAFIFKNKNERRET